MTVKNLYGRYSLKNYPRATNCDGHPIACPQHENDGWCFMQLERDVYEIGKNTITGVAKRIREIKKHSEHMTRDDVVGVIIDEALMMQVAHDSGDIDVEDAAARELIARASMLLEMEY